MSNKSEKKILLNRAEGLWDEVLRRLAPELEEALENIGDHVPCPFKEHSDSKDGFRMFEDAVQTGGGICNTCGSYPDGISLLMKVRSWDFKECLETVAGCLGDLEAEGFERVEKASQEPDADDEDVAEELKLIIDKAEGDNGRISKYLKSRGLSGQVSENFLFYPRMRYRDKTKGKTLRLDTMVTYVETVNREVVGLHYTHLSRKRNGKANVTSPKKFSRVLRKGALKGAAIYLGEAAETMGIAEGIETALAVSEATGTPMMVTPSTLMRFAEFPPVVKRVEIWADNDSSGVGERAADALADRLLEKGYDIFLMLPPEVGMDWLDVAVDPDLGAEAIVMAQNEADQYVFEQEEFEQEEFEQEEFEQEESGSYKKPLCREKEAPIPFPIDALGDFLGKVSPAVQGMSRAPEALCAQCLLAVASLVVQGIADLDLIHGVRPLSCFFFTLGESGERKSTVDNIVLKSVREYEASCRPVQRAKLEAYRIQTDLYEKKMKEACKAESKHEEESITDSIGMPPAEPHGATMLAGDPTIEGLMNFMMSEQPSVGLFSDEGGRVIGGHGMQQDARLRTAAGLSVLWDGNTLSSQRAGGSMSVSGKRLSVHLMLQPDVAEKFLGDELMKSQGILSRILITEPKSTIGTRFYKMPNSEMMATMSDFNQRILEILQHGYTFKKDTESELEPRKLPLSDDAMTVFIAFHDEVEAELSEDGAYSEIRGFASKAAEHAARLAGVLTLIEDINAPEVTKEKMGSGVALGRYYLHEAKRQFVASVEDPVIVSAGEVLKWMQRCGEKNHALVDIYQKGPQGVRTAEKAREVLDVLEAHGWVKQTGKKKINGKMRREVWQLVE